MGPCSHCGHWLKPVLVLADEHDNRGWILEPVDEFEVGQITRGKHSNGDDDKHP